MDKFLLQQQVLERLADDLLQVEQAARVAHETATHEENIAENKYDTLGLEAAYLATGQVGAPKPFARPWPIGASFALGPTTPARASNWARWSAWSMPTTHPNTSSLDRTGAA